MIDEQRVEFNGRVYLWSCDDGIARPEECWTWTDERHLSAPQAVIEQLNRKFITERANEVRQGIALDDLARFSRLLKSMGATNAEIDELGLTETSEETCGHRQTEIALEMPPSSFSPFNCEILREWFFSAPRVRWQQPFFVGCIGIGPFTQENLDALLNRHNVFRFPYSPVLPVVILGREGWERYCQ